VEGPIVRFAVQETDSEVILISKIQQMNAQTSPGDKSGQVIRGSLFIISLFVPGDIISWNLWAFSWDDPIDQVSNERESMVMVGQATTSFKNQATNLHDLVLIRQREARTCGLILRLRHDGKFERIGRLQTWSATSTTMALENGTTEIVEIV
jgi:hypothetical protein